MHRTTTADGPDRVRHEADRLQAGDAPGHLHRRLALEQSEAGERITLAAVQRAKAGDADAVRLLYLRYANNVYGYVCSVVRDEHEAEDVTQQVFARLMTALARYEPRSVPFSGWILRVAHNVAIDHLRQRRPVPCEAVRSLSEEDPTASRDRVHALRSALEVLPGDQRDVAVLRFIVGLSSGEIAARMGRSEDAVYGLAHRGRRRLQAELRGMLAAPAALPEAV